MLMQMPASSWGILAPLHALSSALSCTACALLAVTQVVPVHALPRWWPTNVVDMLFAALCGACPSYYNKCFNLVPCERRPPSAAEVLRMVAGARGWVVGSGLPDEARAGRLLLKDYTDGRLVHCEWPPEPAEPAAVASSSMWGGADEAGDNRGGAPGGGGHGRDPEGGAEESASCSSSSSSADEQEADPQPMAAGEVYMCNKLHLVQLPVIFVMKLASRSQTQGMNTQGTAAALSGGMSRELVLLRSALPQQLTQADPGDQRAALHRAAGPLQWTACLSWARQTRISCRASVKV